MKDRIALVIKHANIKQVDFAKRLGVTPAHVSKLVSGSTKPSDRTISDICREFGCDEVWLRTGEGEPFRRETDQEKIMKFAVRTVKGSDDFRKALVAMLADMTDEEWAGLHMLTKKMLQIYKKE